MKVTQLEFEWPTEEPVKPCPDGLLPDGEKCPRCGGSRAPSGVNRGTWVHSRRTTIAADGAKLEFEMIRAALGALELRGRQKEGFDASPR